MTSDNTQETGTYNTKNPREAAYLALLTSVREEMYLSDSLNRWKEKMAPSSADFGLAREVAFGSCRMGLALDHMAEQLADKDKLKLKLKERILMRTALYQHYYMDRIPVYAFTNETIEIAKKYCHETFVRFLNAILRKIAEQDLNLPKGDTVPDISIRYSYPAFFVQELIQNYSLDKAIEIMEAGNKSSSTMFRIRPPATIGENLKEAAELITGTLVPMAILKDASFLPEIASSPDYYIQNVTPATLVQKLAQNLEEPKRVLDLCASPGGKILAVHDLFPSAKLFANDLTAKKLNPLSENCAKYGMPATLSSGPGEDFTSDEPFDLVILDVPCSNSGVLNKRPEARWRISMKTLEQLEELQLRLLKNAVNLLSDDGEIWYLTCSILKKENTTLIEKACELFNLQVKVKEVIFPNQDGWDGGFACALQKKK